MTTLLGSISLLAIQKQINAETLKTLTEYQEVLLTNDEAAILKFQERASNWMPLVGEGFTVEAKVRGMKIEHQRSISRLLDQIQAMYRGHWLECRMSKNQKEIEFLLTDSSICDL